MIKTKQNTLFVSSLAKGLRVMRIFDETHPHLSLSELAKLSGLDRSAVQRLANTLHLEGMLDRDPRTKRYSPSINWLKFAYVYYWSDPLIAAAMPQLIVLSQKLSETVNLARLEGDRIIYVARLPSKRTIFAAAIPGRSVPALNTSAGQAILASFPQPERQQALESWMVDRHTVNSTLDRQLLGQQIEEAVQEGYAITSGQMLLGETGVACAIADHDGRARAAVHCSVSGHTWDKEAICREILPSLQDAANAISLRNRDIWEN